MPFSIDLIPLLEYAARSQLFKFIASIPTEMATDTISELYQYAEPTIVVAKQFTFTKLTIIDSTYFDCWFTNYYRVYYPRPVPVIIIIEEPKTWQSELLYYCSNWYFLAAVLSIIVIGLISLILYYYRGARIVVAARLKITGVLESVGNAVFEARMIFEEQFNAYLWSSICSTAFIMGLVYIANSISSLGSIWINSVAAASICSTLWHYWNSPLELISITEILSIITYLFIDVCFLVQTIAALATGYFAGDASNIGIAAEMDLEPLVFADEAVAGISIAPLDLKPLVVNVVETAAGIILVEAELEIEFIAPEPVEATAETAIAPLDLKPLVVNVVETAAGIILVEAELEIEFIAPEPVEAAAEVHVDAKLDLEINEERAGQDEAILEIVLEIEKEDSPELGTAPVDLTKVPVTNATESTNADASTSALKFDNTTVASTTPDLDTKLQSQSSNEEVVETVENNVDDSLESTPVNMESPAESTSYSTEVFNATASSSPLKLDDLIPTIISAAMNTTQQSDSPVEDVVEILPQPQPLPITATGIPTPIAKETSDSSKNEPVALDLIEPVAGVLAESILTTPQEYLQASNFASTSTFTTLLYLESSALQRSFSNDSMDSGYNSSPNEASSSTSTTSQAIWNVELPILPPSATEATQAQESLTADSASKENEAPSRNLMEPVTNTIKTIFTTSLTILNLLQIGENCKTPSDK